MARQRAPELVVVGVAQAEDGETLAGQQRLGLRALAQVPAKVLCIARRVAVAGRRHDDHHVRGAVKADLRAEERKEEEGRGGGGGGRGRQVRASIITTTRLAGAAACPLARRTVFQSLSGASVAAMPRSTASRCRPSAMLLPAPVCEPYRIRQPLIRGAAPAGPDHPHRAPRQTSDTDTPGAKLPAANAQQSNETHSFNWFVPLRQKHEKLCSNICTNEHVRP